ncbi:MAG: RNA pseudouridine synthase [Saprospiraceae bacterium]|nr:RNA pseudouridine synthase [Saprospiraceae bacterium]
MENNEEQKIGDWVIYKNNQFIAFNKPAGLPSQSDKTNDKSLAQLAEIYAKQSLFLTHRLDRPASGVILFGKTNKAVAAINEQFQKRSITKTYLAAVKEMPPKESDELVHFIKKDKRQNKVVALTEEAPDAKKASLTYKLIGSSKTYHLLEIELHSGRHHQIRAQLQAIGCPIKGDVKYGFRRGNRDRSIHLHAWKLLFEHPVSRKQEEVMAALPDDPVWNGFKENGII